MSGIRERIRATAGWLLIAVLLFLAGAGGSWAANQPSVGDSMPAAGGALVHAGQKDWQQAAKELEQFEASWKALGRLLRSLPTT